MTNLAWRWANACFIQPVILNRRAVIDVGTNSVKVLVADVRGREVRPVLETSRQTRLGQGFYESRMLQAGPVADSARAVADFASLARESGALFGGAGSRADRPDTQRPDARRVHPARPLAT